jgi:esterase/lipase superfamily enzyme
MRTLVDYRVDRRASLAAMATLLLISGPLGCGGTKLKPMPVIYGSGHADLCELTPESRRSPDVKVFYATNRNGSGRADNREYHNGVDDKLHLGSAVVRAVGKKGTWDQLCRDSLGKGGNPTFKMDRATELASLGGKSAPDPATAGEPFYRAINEQLAISPSKQVNVYVHGFRTNMAMEVETQAKLLHCLARRGAVVCFIWPSRQNLLLYGADVDRGMKSAPYLTDLVQLLAEHTDAERINLLGYSCGSAVTTKALCDLRDRYAGEDPKQLSKRLRIGNVILAASDIDLKTFARDQLDQLKDLSDNVVIYIAENDMALGISSLSYGASRLGRPDVSKLNMTKAQLEDAAKDTSLQVIDVTDVPGPHASGGGFGGHGYWYANSWIMTDLLVMLRWQVAAAERGLVQKPGLARWFFPKDYPKRINEAVQQLAEPKTVPATSPATVDAPTAPITSR